MNPGPCFVLTQAHISPGCLYHGMLSLSGFLLRKNLPFSNIRLEIIILRNVHQLVDFFMGGQGNNNLSLEGLIAR